MSTIISQLENTIRDSFPFTIGKYRLSGPENMATDHFGLFRSDNLECIGNACSERYKPHTIDDVVALAQAGASAFENDAKVTCAWRNGHYLNIAPSDDYRRSIFGTDDNVFPRLIISAGYDGKSFRGSMGFYSDACRNLAMLRSVGVGVSESIKHTHSLTERMSELREQFCRISGKWDDTVQVMARMEANTVSLKEFLAEIYPPTETDSKRSQTIQTNRIEKIFRRVVDRRIDTGRPRIANDWMVSAWEAYNAVQGYVQHDQPRHGTPDYLERAIMAFDSKAVRQAEQLALAS